MMPERWKDRRTCSDRPPGWQDVREPIIGIQGMHGMKIIAIFLCLLSVVLGLIAFFAGIFFMLGFPHNDRGGMASLLLAFFGALLLSDAALIQLLIKRLNDK